MQIKQKLREFYQAARSLMEEWGSDEAFELDDALVEKYPFDRSFTEVVSDIREWTHTHDDTEEEDNGNSKCHISRDHGSKRYSSED